MSVLVVGSLNSDLFILTVAGLPQPGETLFGQSKKSFIGGKGSNQAVAAARLKGRVFMCGAIGKDEEGTTILSALKQEGVNIDNIIKRGDTTGFALVTVSGQGGENTVIVIPGANSLLDTKDISMKLFSDSSIQIVLCQNEIPLSVTYETFRLGKEKNIITFWNPAPAPKENCDDILKYVDILCVNESEAISISGKKEIFEAIKVLVKTCPIVIVTLGKKGCMLIKQDVPNQPIHIPPYFVENVVDTTGAGDCFCGSLALFLVKKVPLEQAIKLSNYVAAQSVTKHGAQASYPYLSDLSPEVAHLLGGTQSKI